MSELHVCWTEISGYLPRVRRVGCRRYEILGKPRKLQSTALIVLAKAMATGNYKRGDVLACPPMHSYYEPHIIFEMVKS